MQKLEHYHIMLHALTGSNLSDMLTVVLSFELCMAWPEHLSQLGVVGCATGRHSMCPTQTVCMLQCKRPICCADGCRNSNIPTYAVQFESVQLRVSATAQDRGKADLDGVCST